MSNDSSVNDPVYTVKYMLGRLEAKVDKVIDDHEERIRGLEADKSQRRGAYSVVTSTMALLAAAAAVAGVFFH